MRGIHMQPSLRRTAVQRRAFTLVELLVSVSIVAILSGMLLLGTTAVYENFRKSTTQQTFRTVGFAIDTFSQDNPLRTHYDAPPRLGGLERSYGSFPPYQVEVNGPGSIGALIEPASEPFTGRQFRPSSLAQRLTRDLSGYNGFIDQVPAAGGPSWIDNFVSASDPIYRANDDNRALYAYLRAYNPAGISQVGAESLRPLPRAGNLAPATSLERIRLPGTGGFAPPSYAGGSSDSENWAEVRGFVDGWGNPLDYMLYVKVEPGVRFDPIASGVNVGWRVTDRQWVLRSHGITEDQYRLNVTDAAANRPVVWDDSAAMYSSPLPTPYAGPKLPAGSLQPALPLGTGLLLPTGGGLNPTQQREGGWTRLRADGEWTTYNYLPGASF